jgi:hypothetical protein
MLILIIESDEYKLHGSYKKQKELIYELLSRYSDETIVTITDEDGIELEKTQLQDLFGEMKYIN